MQADRYQDTCKSDALSEVESDAHSSQVDSEGIPKVVISLQCMFLLHSLPKVTMHVALQDQLVTFDGGAQSGEVSLVAG